MNQLYTSWGINLDVNNILSEYPRPQLKRDSYLNLNGYWDYAISSSDEINGFDGKILVPFSPESVLSGVNRFVKPDEYLFYQRKVILPDNFRKDKLILHFGAVDQIAEVWINGQFVGKHTGGFTPFSFEISDYVDTNEFLLNLRVKDFSNTSYQETGKQRIKSGGIWYTPQSGIWQTPWLESVPNDYIKGLKLTPLYIEKAIKFFIDKTGNEEFLVEVYFKGEIQGNIKTTESEFTVPIRNRYPWSPGDPNLYDIKISYGKDRVESYLGMRLFERKKDQNGIYRFYLNQKPYFLSGVLDQGYYPDGLLTPPSDAAMENDIKTMKQMGFNLLRKHIKIEPLRWYYYCDKLGMIVFQDMINGGERSDILFHGILANTGFHLKDNKYYLFGRKNEIGRNQYYIELEEMINHLYSVTSITTWVPFNEAWGQFDSKKAVELINRFDDTRLIDHASGWSDQGVGDYHSRHIYFTKIRFRKRNAKKRINALTEFGGYSLALNGHRYNEEKVFGYKVFNNTDDLEKAYEDLSIKQILPQLDNGLSVLIYTQLSDVEDEVNGFITYDRKVIKINPFKVLEINQKLYHAFNKIIENRQ